MQVVHPRKRLILLEFNELCPSLIDKFIAEGILPNFEALRDASERFVTSAADEVLEPWIQWVTVHTGVPLAEHGILDLDEADKLVHSPFWEAFEEDNVLLMSPMNVKARRGRGSLFFPDPWAASQPPSEELEALHRFVRLAVTNHARTDKLGGRDAAAALRFLLAHGLSARSMTKIVRQVAEERLGRRDVKWRRASILDLMLWDVFAHFWKSELTPRVGVFFSNATAHYQHKYWWHYDPSAFRNKPDERDVQAYGDVIRFGYRAHDDLIGKAMALADENTVLALCTALSQQPMRDYESRGGKAMFIARDYAKLFQMLGAPNARVEALMAEESWLHYSSEAEAGEAFAVLRDAKTSRGDAIFKTRAFNGRSFIVGCGVFAGEVGGDTCILGDRGRRAPFSDHFLKMDTVTTAKHHPDGVLWVADPQGIRKTGTEPLPLTRVRQKLEQALHEPQRLQA
jgi:hypothetical protein